MDRSSATTLAVVLGLAVLLAGFALRPATEAEPIETIAPMAAAPDIRDAGAVVVHVAGAVAEPGVVRLELGARVTDAIEAAGGMLPEAIASAVNLARVVQDGEQIYVPVVGEESSTGININRSSSAELERLPGIGPALAECIVAYREAHGPFGSLSDLAAVSGIGKALVEALAGAAWKAR